MVQDYRSKSYSDKARTRFSSSPSKNKKVRLKEGSVVEGIGQVAISGGKDNVEFVDQQNNVESAQKSSSVNVLPTEGVKNLFSGQISKEQLQSGEFDKRSVAISSRLAGKLKQQSIRDDASYNIYSPSRVKQSVDIGVYSDQGFKTTSKKSLKTRLGQAYEASPLYTIEKGTKYLFVNPVKRDQYDTYSDIPSEQAKIKESKEGKRAAQELLVGAAVGFTAKSSNVISGKANLKSRSGVKVLSSPEGKSISSAKIQGEGEVSRKLFGIFPLKKKKVSFTGTASASSEPTGSYGGISKEPIIKTKGVSSFDVQIGKKKYVVSSESTGGQVGDIGQRQTSIETSLKGGKVISSGSIIETNFIKKVGEDDFISGSFSKRGVDAVAGKKVLSYGDVVSNEKLVGKYVDPVTDLDFAGGGSFQGKKLVVSTSGKAQSVEVGIYDVGAGSITGIKQKDLPGGLKFVTGDIVSKLKAEKAGSFKSEYSPVLFKKASGESQSGGYVDLGYKFDNVLKQGVENVGTVKAKVFTPVTNIKKGETTTESVSVTRFSGGRFVDTPLVVSSQRSVNREVLSQLPSSSSLVNQSSTSSVGSLFRSRSLSGLRSREATSQSLSSVGVLSQPSVSSAVEVVPKTLSKQSSAQALRFSPSLATQSIYRSGFVSSASPVVSTPIFGVPKGGKFDFKFGGREKFSVELRRGGVFKSVGKGLGLGEAIKLGTRSAQGTAGRTFRIKKGGGEVVTGLKAGKGFYSGKGGNIIESSQSAINTSGELKEITYKGINVQRRKNSGVF